MSITYEEEVLKSFINSKNEWLSKKVANQVKEIEKIKALNTDYLYSKVKDLGLIFQT